jgi:cyanophycin synthetase
VERTDCTNWDAGQRLLINRGVEAAVIENGPRTILGEGLAYDRCRVGVVTDTVWSEDLGDYDVRDPEQMFDILRTQVDVVLPDGAAVLDADDPLVSRMASLCDGEVILYGPDSRSPAIVEQRDRGGRAVFLQGDRIVMSRGRDDAGIVELAAFANAAAGPPAISDRGVLAAVASACALGLPEELIRVGIETFGTEGNPARSSGKRNRQRGSRAEAAPRG